MGVIRDAIMSVKARVSGQEDVRELDDEIDQTGVKAAQAEEKFEDVGDEAEQAGEEGEESWSAVNSVLESTEAQLGVVSAASTGAAFTLGSAADRMSDAAGDWGIAVARTEGLAGEGAQQLIRGAERIEESSNFMFSASEVLQSQQQLLRGGFLDPEQVAEVAPAIANIAATTKEDLRDVFEEFRDPLIEGAGAIQLLTKGYVDMQDIIREINPELVGQVHTLARLEDRTTRAERRQAILNATIKQGRRVSGGAENVQQTYNARMLALSNVIGKATRVMGEGFLPRLSELIGRTVEWGEHLVENRKGLLKTIGKFTAAGAIIAGVTAIVSTAVLAWFALGTAIGATVGWAVAIGAAIAALTIPLIDVISWAVTGQTVFFELGTILDVALLGPLAGLVWVLEDLFGFDFSKMFMGFSGAVADEVSAAVSAFVGAEWWDKAWAVTKTMGEGIGAGFSQVWANLKQSTNWVLEMLEPVWETAVDWAGVGWGIVKGIGQGIKDGADYVVDSVLEVAHDAREYLPGSDAKLGPFSELTMAGEAIPETIGKGIESRDEEINESFEQVDLEFGVTATEDTRRKGGGSETESADPSNRETATDEILLRIVDESDTAQGEENVRNIAREVERLISDRINVQLEGAF